VASQPLAFGALLIAGIIGEAAIKGSSPTDVVQGNAPPLSSLSGGTTANPTGTTANPTGTVSVSSLGFGSSTTLPDTAAGDAASHLGGGSTSIPTAVANAYNRALSLVGVPYVYGGGHAASALTESAQTIAATTGLDCSALVSNVLGPAGAKVLDAVDTTGTLAASPQLIPGAGKYITVYDDSTGAGGLTHTFIEIAGRFFQAPQPGQDVQQMSSQTVAALLHEGSFAKSHPVGL
jgi:cell wall-associated NlpC family hydrolase